LLLKSLDLTFNFRKDSDKVTLCDPEKSKNLALLVPVYRLRPSLLCLLAATSLTCKDGNSPKPTEESKEHLLRGNEGSGVSGGDHLYQLFFEGRKMAEGKLARLVTLDRLPPLYPSHVEEWFFQFRNDLLSDFQGTEIFWIQEEHPLKTCALTGNYQSAPIQLSLAGCKHIRTADEVVKLLFHELSHHFQANEELATELGVSLFDAHEHVWPAETRISSCQTADIFSPTDKLCFEFVDLKDAETVQKQCEEGWGTLSPGSWYRSACPQTNLLAGCHFTKESSNLPFQFANRFASYLLWFYKPTQLNRLEANLCGEQTYIQVCDDRKRLVPDFSENHCDASEESKEESERKF
jgi:hypothetical protein